MHIGKFPGKISRPGKSSLAPGIGSIGALWFSRRNQPLSACRIIPVEVADFTING
jgi:hypothetical protein